MIDDIRATLPPSIKQVMDSAEAYWQRRMGLRSEEVCHLIVQIELQAEQLVTMQARIKTLENALEHIVSDRPIADVRGFAKAALEGKGAAK